MASRTSTDPIEILLEMGVDLDNLSEEEDYLSALMEAVNTLQIKNAGDDRIGPLQQEIRKVRQKRKAADPKFKVRKTKISADAFKKGTASEVRDNVKTGVIDPSKLKFDSVEVGLKPKALPTSAIVAYQAPEAEEDTKAKTKKKEKPTNLLEQIAKSVTNIADTLKDQYNLKKKSGEFDRKKAQRDKRKLNESNLEKGFSALFKTAQKIIAPVRGIFDKIFGFIANILIGKFLVKLIGWISKPDNQKKLKNIIQFLGKHWPKLLSLYLVFGTGLGRFIFSLTKTLIGGAVKLTVAIAKLLAAKKLVGGLGARKFARLLGGKKGKFLAAGLTTALTVGGTYAATSALAGGGGETQTQGFSGGGLAKPPKVEPLPKNAERNQGMSGAQKGMVFGSLFGPLGMAAGAGIGSLFDNFGNKKDDTVKLSSPAKVELEVSSGTDGEVDGPGGTDKVPAMLTAGEFVMSRGAVQKYGVKALEGMNAAGGGTNLPKMVKDKVYAAGGGYVGGEGGPEKMSPLQRMNTHFGDLPIIGDVIRTVLAYEDKANYRGVDQRYRNMMGLPPGQKPGGEGGPYTDPVINMGVTVQRQLESRLVHLIHQAEQIIPRIETALVGIAVGSQALAQQTQLTLEQTAIGAYRQSEQFATGLANAGQQVANDVVNYYESGDMQRQIEKTGRGIFDTAMSAGESLKGGATSAIAGTFDGLSAVASSEPYTKMTEITASVNEDNIKAMDSIVDSLPEGSPMQDMVDKGLIPIPTGSPSMMRNMTFIKAMLGPLGKPFKIMSNPEVDRMRQLTIDKTLEKSGLVMGKDGEVKMNWNQEDINKGRAGGGAYTDDLGPGGKAFNSILGRFTASTRDGGNELYTDDVYNFNKSAAKYLELSKEQLLSGAFGEAGYFAVSALGKFAEDIGWLNQRALGSRIAVGEVDRNDKRIIGSAKPTTATPNVAAAVKQFEGGKYDAATKALGGDPSKPEPIPQLTAPAPKPGKPQREWYDPRGWVGMNQGGMVSDGNLKMGTNTPRFNSPEAPMQAKVSVIRIPKTKSNDSLPAPRGGSRTPDINAGNGSASKRKILGIV